jgi:hypothetical protein
MTKDQRNAAHLEAVRRVNMDGVRQGSPAWLGAYNQHLADAERDGADAAAESWTQIAGAIVIVYNRDAPRDVRSTAGDYLMRFAGALAAGRETGKRNRAWTAVRNLKSAANDPRDPHHNTARAALNFIVARGREATEAIRRGTESAENARWGWV